MDKYRELRTILKKNGWLLVFLAAGLLLLCIPDGDRSGASTGTATDSEIRLAGALSRMEGVGETYVLLSEKPGREGGFTGAVIVCAGGADPGVQLRITEAVRAFTSLGSDKIIVQKLVS